MKRLKITALGESRSGKTSLFCSSVGKQFPFIDFIIGKSYYEKQAVIQQILKSIKQNQEVEFHLWDVTGNEKCKLPPPMYFRDSYAVLIIYDITNRQTFQKNVKLYNSTIVLVGAKQDLNDERQVSYQEAQQIANSLGILFFETSAKSCYNIDLLFTEMAQELGEIN